MVERLTDKKLQNKRFRATEESIILAVDTAKDFLSLNRFVKMAGISRATLYRHHGNLSGIVPNYERYILHKSHSTILRLMHNHHIHLRTLFERILFFMIANKKIMELLTRHGKHDINEEIIVTLKSKIISTSKVKDGEMFLVYLKEVAGIIEEWQNAGFKRKEIAPTLDKIMYMTETAYIRLSPLEDYR